MRADTQAATKGYVYLPTYGRDIFFFVFFSLFFSLSFSNDTSASNRTTDLSAPFKGAIRPWKRVTSPGTFDRIARNGSYIHDKDC